MRDLSKKYWVLVERYVECMDHRHKEEIYTDIYPLLLDIGSQDIILNWKQINE